MPRQRDIQDFVDKAFWGLLVGVVTLGVSFLQDMSRSVSSLNEKLGVIVEKVAIHEARISDHERRIVEHSLDAAKYLGKAAN